MTDHDRMEIARLGRRLIDLEQAKRPDFTLDRCEKCRAIRQEIVDLGFEPWEARSYAQFCPSVSEETKGRTDDQ